MKRTYGKLTSLLLCLTMLLSLCAFPALAAETSGTCGDSLSWSFNNATGTLTVSGTGDMDDYCTEAGAENYSEAPWYSFRGEIKTVAVEEGVTSIGDYAFFGCTDMTYVVLPASLLEIKPEAFAGCDALADLYYLGSQTQLTELIISEEGNDPLLDATVTFGRPTTEPDVEVTQFSGKCGDKVTWKLDSETGELLIEGEGPMYDYEPAKAPWSGNSDLILFVTIRDGVTSIGSYAFKDCSFMEYADITKSVAAMGEGAFDGCVSLRSVNLPTMDAIPAYAFRNCTVLEQIQVPSYVQTIGADAFQNCSGLTVATISRDVKTIEAGAFMGCDNMSIHYCGTETEWTKVSVGPDTIPEDTEVTYGGYTMEAVTLTPCGPNTYFQYLDNSRTLKITGTGTVTSTPWTVFSHKFTRIEINDGVTALCIGAFRGSAAVRSVVIPTSVDTIGASAFAECGKLTDIYYGGTEADWNKIIIGSSAIPAGVTKHFTEGETEATPTPPVTPDVTPDVTPGVDPTPTPTPVITPSPDKDPETCVHTLYFIPPTVEATCTTPGYTGSIVCGKFCGTVLMEASPVDALGHHYVKGVCTRCSEKDPNYDPDKPITTPTPTPTPPAGEKSPFHDVTESDYYYAPVLWAVEEDITSGIGGGMFGSDNPCTRGQIVTFLWRAAGSPEPESDSASFSDVKKTDYFYKAVLWAVENEITSGVSGSRFAPDAPCSRAQVATFLWRAQGSPEAKTTTNPFTDVTEDNYFFDAVLWAYENDITGGIGDGKFGSDKPCTRAQIVTFLYRAENK